MNAKISGKQEPERKPKKKDNRTREKVNNVRKIKQSVITRVSRAEVGTDYV